MQAPNFDRTSPVPLYLQIKEWMLEQIRTGRWPHRYKLPAEEDLAADIGVSRGTLRKAIRKLVAEGFLEQIHGKGTFVTAGGIEQPLAQQLAAFSELLEERGIPYSTQVLRQEVMVPEPRVAALLRLSPGEPAVFLARVRLVESRPVAYMENYVPRRLAPGLEEVDFTRHGLFATLEQRYGLTLSWGHRTFEALAADGRPAEYLDLPPGAPVFYIQQVVYLAGGTPVEYSDVWLRGDRFRLSAVVRRRPWDARDRGPAGAAAGPQRASTGSDQSGAGGSKLWF
ncbi:MAG TPA: GntR family transcriptional regulator [Thermaerobacter sp.]